ncbi:proton-translocating transhydrogenase family protein [Amphiplicatus metriothermophilus]|uniref:proton-translocating NAD(P)(+) transhydrogenase n=1 Tax=Amphiplicatus metriothermophilus TaxID=1519374 RepID=A0A239PPZ0_9PROT|nr:proton-translocating transhydrogenase family protein [Amphiplicatus metriothermophilus]MBB5518642.1 NAD(P) transhydrogenase subunit alpha [Amphiplicatus metriothermophilus]SNT72200.1 NAD(P) transhydrogenase subunit alpha [Amphiplicatus metriothermophilus]
MQATKETVEEAARAAEEAAKAAETAAANATTNAEAAAAAAEQARTFADQLAALAASLSGPSEFVYLLAIFILAIFVGYYVVWSVTPALHTPLMSVTNAISSVVIVGALIAVGADLADSAAGGTSKLLGFIAVALASVNIFGGFLVTQRMLGMYRKKER